MYIRKLLYGEKSHYGINGGIQLDKQTKCKLQKTVIIIGTAYIMVLVFDI